MIGDDYIIDRYKLKNSVNKWKFIALTLFFSALFVVFYNKGDGVPQIKSDYIASIDITGMLLQDKEVIKSLNKIASDNNIKAVLVNINSSGGTGVGGELLYREFRKIAQKKPIVSSIGEIGASAAYMAAIGTDRIYAYDISLVGSIGVIIMNFEVSEFAKKYGINLELIKSSPLKGIPNYFEKLNDQQKEYVQNLVDESNKFFIELVKKRRNLSENDLKKVSDGRIFIGSQANKLKLIDEIGDRADAIKWLKSKENLENLEVKDYVLLKPASRLERLMEYTDNVKLIFSTIFNTIVS
ncbi:MAG: signal peptide peptidase SppA [Burkholderiales bacterium]|nr:signal peptide peptidase SppA [Burkholderiales bacterium]